MADPTKVCLGTDRGYFLLSYEGDVPESTSNDWMGLYTSPSSPNEQWIGGNNWQYATRGTKYLTNTYTEIGYEMRYFKKEGTDWYVIVKRSGPLTAPSG